MEEWLRQAQELEHKGLWQESIQIYKRILQDYPNNPDGLYYYAENLFQQKIYDGALDLFVQCYNHAASSNIVKEKVIKHVRAAYYEPNVNVFRSNYQQNVACLLDYEHNYICDFPDFEDIPFVCIPGNAREFYIFDKQRGIFGKEKLTLSDQKECKLGLSPDDRIFAVNIFDIAELSTIVTETTNSDWPNGFKLPMYMLWKNCFAMVVYLQLGDYRPLINKNRMVFFSDFGDNFLRFFQDHRSILPQKILGEPSYNELIKMKFSEIAAERLRDINEKRAFVQQVVSKYNREYYKKLFTGDPSNIRILFYTSRFTRVVQYATRDMLKACQDRGITCELLIEESDLQQAGSEALIEKIAQFQPNVIFRINFFKLDYPDIPENMLFITWMQDPGDHIYSVDFAQKFAWNDFAIALPAWGNVMIATGFEPARLLYQKVPIDTDIFFPRELSASEQEFYGADVAMPANYNIPGCQLIDLARRSVSAEIRESFIAVLIDVYDALSYQADAGILIHSSKQCVEIIREACATAMLNLAENIIDYIAEQLFLYIYYIIQRRTTLKWVIDAGFQLKLWGLGWDKDLIFKEYNKGILKHGPDLAKMFSATKIILASCSHQTGHARVFEALACGALPMLRYVPDEHDYVNLRDQFKENEHFVFYYDQQDLIDKLRFYLTHEDERRRIADNGRKRVLETMTYKIAVDNMLGLIRRNML
jgi:hypothetical protein